MRYYIAVSIAISVFVVPWLATQFPKQADYIIAGIRNVGSQLAAVIVHNPRTIAQLHEKYDTNNIDGLTKIRVLIMPGHEPNYGGAEYGTLRERDLTVQVASNLAEFLSTNNKYEVIVARDKQAWNPIFQAYFKDAWNSITEWQKDHKEESLRKILQVGVGPAPKVQHNSAPTNVASRLYGLTKWSNENNVDITIHIHFNDYPGHAGNVPGKYSGFSIYVPEAQYANSTTTRAIAQSVYGRLQKYNPVSDFPGESDGIIDERELIAIGANDTADSASMLIEYAYIYETQIVNQSTRDMALKDLAYQTYLGLEDFFNQGKTMISGVTYDTLILPYTWNDQASVTNLTRDIYALQTALQVDGVYPPSNKSKNDCPRTGTIGPCTREAIKAFQGKYGLEMTGTVGPKTMEKLNGLYSVKSI